MKVFTTEAHKGKFSFHQPLGRSHLLQHVDHSSIIKVIVGTEVGAEVGN